ncbi:MAG: hypothetical protein ACLVHS_13030 [Blautia wexlerae]
MSYEKFDEMLKGIKTFLVFMQLPLTILLKTMFGIADNLLFVTEVTCLAIDLADNIKAKDAVIKIE